MGYECNEMQAIIKSTIINRRIPWGPLKEGHWPPQIFGWGQQWFWPPKIWEVYNNSNLVNNEVYNKLTTKLASMKYYENLVWYHFLNLLTQLLDFLLYMITEYSQ